MASKYSSSPELATAAVGHPWDGNKKVVLIFEKSYTITEFLSFFDKLRLNSDPLKNRISNKASRLFYTFSGLHFLLKQVYAVAIHDLEQTSSIEMEELKRHFETCSDYFSEFTRILKIVEIYYLELIVDGESLPLTSDYLEEVIKNEKLMALEQRVREDQLVVPYLLTVLEREGLNISATLIQDMLCINQR